MREQRINILSDEVLCRADAICFTSNGILKKDGTLVMGAGVAKQFTMNFNNLARDAGIAVRKYGNICQFVREEQVHNEDYLSVFDIIAFPTKNHWKDSSDLDLIIKSAKELIKLCDELNYKNVFLPRPGIGMGQLNLVQVKAAIELILDDRIIVTYL